MSSGVRSYKGIWEQWVLIRVQGQRVSGRRSLGETLQSLFTIFSHSHRNLYQYWRRHYITTLLQTCTYVREVLCHVKTDSVSLSILTWHKTSVSLRLQRKYGFAIAWKCNADVNTDSFCDCGWKWCITMARLWYNLLPCLQKRVLCHVKIVSVSLSIILSADITVLASCLPPVPRLVTPMTLNYRNRNKHLSNVKLFGRVWRRATTGKWEWRHSWRWHAAWIILRRQTTLKRQGRRSIWLHLYSLTQTAWALSETRHKNQYCKQLGKVDDL